MGAKELRGKADAVLEASNSEINALLDQGRFKEAKLVLTSAQRDLRDIKREATDEQRQIRPAATDARLTISDRGQTIGLFMGSKARGAMAHGRADAKRNVARKQADMLRPYDVLKSGIDAAIAQLDRVKAEVAQAIASEREEDGADRGSRQETTTDAKQQDETPPAAESAPSASPLPPPHWARDPVGRHQLRWWDGSRWTEYVSNAGAVATDPLSG